MKKILWQWAVLCLFFVASARAQFSDPFAVEAHLSGDTLEVSVQIPPNHVLYADAFKVTDGAGVPPKAIKTPKAHPKKDALTGQTRLVFSKSFQATYQWNPSAEGAESVHVFYQGCDDSACFMPQEKQIALNEKVTIKATEKKETAPKGWRNALNGFEITEKTSGYMDEKEFLAFLGKAEGMQQEKLSGIRLFLEDPLAFVRQSGLPLTLFFILLGGLALNLTPCVLPMIPINLAIIGAGAQAGSKKRGFVLGGAYGLGIALTYGLLGAGIVLTGSRFGALQSSPWFNIAIALIFLVLALAMFDLLQIDFSRFQAKLGGSSPKKQGSVGVALSMGALSALLAGACVAPVVIAVLLLAVHLGSMGLLLPFVLGLGMALPWPLAGAGLSFLPKPGKWMTHVKYAFGVGILLFALYYAHLAYRGFRPATSHAGGANGHLIVAGTDPDAFSEALNQAHQSGKPVFIDFWAEWCKNCLAMEKTTFKEAEVKKHLEDYVVIKYVADQSNHPQVRAVLDYFQIQGLPSFVVLKEKK